MTPRRLLALSLCLVMFWTPLLPRLAGAGGLSAAEEDKLGRQMMVALRSSVQFAGDRDLDDFIAMVGRDLARYAETPDFKPQFHLIVDQAMNAFAGPGAVIVVTTGLVEKMDNVDELAGVLAHELAHAARHHISQQIEQQKRLTMIALAGMLAGAVLGVAAGASDLATASVMGATGAAQTQALAFSREHELDADRYGTVLMQKAGYNVKGQLSLLQKLQASQDLQGVNPPQYLSTHPGSLDRIAFLKNLRQMKPADPKRPGADTFQYFAARVQGYSNNWAWFDNKTGLLAEYGRGIRLLGRDELKKALPLLAQVHRKEPGAISPLIDYVRCLRMLGQSSQGLAALNEEPGNSPYRSAIMFWQGWMNLDLGRPAEAERIYRQLVRLHPNDPATLRNLSLALGRQGKLVEAHDALARSFVQLGKRKEALQNFEIALHQAKTKAEKDLIQRHRKEAMELLPQQAG